MLIRHHIGPGQPGKPTSSGAGAGKEAGKAGPGAKSFRRGAALGLLLLAAACGGGAQYAGELYSLDNFYGGIVADEPRAALVAREILAAGGNAADAAVAAYFVMAAKMPSTAGLGGGGVCVVHRGEEDKIADEVFDFLPRPAAGGLVAVPGSARGMAALSARYGKLPWAQLVAPAESIAQTGEAVSRALAKDIAAGEKKLRADPQMAALFVRADGQMLGEGDNLRQSELAGVLGQIRAKGPAELYGGVVGQQLVAGAQALGAPLTIEDLRNFKVQVYAPLEIKWGDQLVLMPKPPAAGGVSVAQMLGALRNAGGDRDAFLAEASRRIMSDRGQWMQVGGDASQPAENLIAEDHVAQVMQGAGQLGGAKPENPFAAGVVAVDAEGLAVACNFTMNALFGAGRIAQGTGVILAPAPDERGYGFSALAPMIMANRNNGEFYFASAASGGMAGALAQADVLNAVTNERLSLEAAMLRARVFNPGDPDVALYDVSGNEDPRAALAAAGFQVEQRKGLGRINAIFCPGGSPTNPETCQLRNDFRGNGLANYVTSD